MDRTRLRHRRPCWLMALALAVALASGCQTVGTSEEKIAKSNLPRGMFNTPGGSASQYFNRTAPTSAGPGRPYNGQDPNDPGKGY